MNSFDIPSLIDTIQQAQAVFATPAVSIAVIREREIIFAGGFGTRTLGAQEPVDENTSYAIASMSKSTVAAALAMLHERNAFHWEDPVRKFLPDFRLMDDFASKEIRVIDLLLHRCGLNSESAGTLWYGSDYSREEVLRRLRFLRPVSSFRSTVAYQNVCFLAAGMIIQAISGQSWDDFVTENLFAPLNMTRTFPTLAALQAAAIDNIATPHAQIDNQLAIIPYRNHDNVGPAASVHSTALDLAYYLLMYLNKGTAGDHHLLSDESIAFLHRPHISYDAGPASSYPHPRLAPRFPAYGLGWQVHDYCNAVSVGHSGGVDGMRCRMELFPELGCGAVVLTNSENSRAYSSILHTALDMLLGVESVDWIAAWEKLPKKDLPTEPEKVPDTLPSLPLESYAGVFRDAAYGDITVCLENRSLVLRFTHTPAFTADLEHWHYNTFRLVWRDRYIPRGLITFSLDSAGKVDAFHLDQPRLLDFTELEERIRKVSEIDS